MEFALGPDHEMVRRMVRDFAQTEIAPAIREWNRKHRTAPRVLPRIGELAGYALGMRQDAPLRCELPAFDPAIWQSEG